MPSSQPQETAHEVQITCPNCEEVIDSIEAVAYESIRRSTIVRLHRTQIEPDTRTRLGVPNNIQYDLSDEDAEDDLSRDDDEGEQSEISWYCPDCGDEIGRETINSILNDGPTLTNFRNQQFEQRARTAGHPPRNPSPLVWQRWTGEIGQIRGQEATQTLHIGSTRQMIDNRQPEPMQRGGPTPVIITCKSCLKDQFASPLGIEASGQVCINCGNLTNADENEQ